MYIHGRTFIHGYLQYSQRPTGGLCHGGLWLGFGRGGSGKKKRK